MSELERLMGIISDVYEKPEKREEFRLELFLMHEKDPALYEQTMVELKKLSSGLHKEASDFIFNVLNIREFLKKAAEHGS